ncbi:hypothetical protein VTO73DRAFT_5834 [Trametes versicolor]
MSRELQYVSLQVFICLRPRSTSGRHLDKFGAAYKFVPGSSFKFSLSSNPNGSMARSSEDLEDALLRLRQARRQNTIGSIAKLSTTSILIPSLRQPRLKLRPTRVQTCRSGGENDAPPHSLLCTEGYAEFSCGVPCRRSISDKAAAACKSPGQVKPAPSTQKGFVFHYRRRPKPSTHGTTTSAATKTAHAAPDIGPTTPKLDAFVNPTVARRHGQSPSTIRTHPPSRAYPVSCSPPSTH